MSSTAAPFDPVISAPEVDPYARWVREARLAGHPVGELVRGRYDRDTFALWSPTMPPNDLLAVAQECARARVSWVHLVMPSLRSMLRLRECIQGPRPVGPARRPGLPTAVSFARLVDEQHVGVRAIVETRDGRALFVLEIPVAWLVCRVAPAAGGAGAASPV